MRRRPPAAESTDPHRRNEAQVQHPVGRDARRGLGRGGSGAGDQFPSVSDESPIQRFSDHAEVDGKSTLTRTENTLQVTVETTGRRPGNAFTVWWVIFNNPAGCSPDESGAPNCGANDINPDGFAAAQIGVGYATGGLAKADGTSEFGGKLMQNDTSGAHQVVVPAGREGQILTGSGLEVEVHMVVQSHGRARDRIGALLKQITLFNAKCNPTCKDVLFAVHK